MATNTLNTRIVICSKTTAQWASVTTVPLKGEMCIEWVSEDSNTLPKIKIGDGTNVYADLPYATFTEKEIKAFISQAAFDLKPATSSVLGGVKIGNNVSVASDGTISIPVASATSASAGTAGVMSVADKNKLNNIASGAEVNQNAFSNVKVGSTTVAADTKTDTLELVAGSNVTLTPDATNDKITIAATDTTYESKAAASGGTDVSLVTTGEKYTWNNAISSVKQDGITGATINRFGTCATEAGTAAKTVSITTGTFNLEAGAKVTVKFTNANTASTPTLNVNSKGAKNIFHKGAQITTGVNKALLAGVCDFVYDGTQWHLIGNYHDTTYSNATTSAAGLMSKDDKTHLETLMGRTISFEGDNLTHSVPISENNLTLKINNTSLNWSPYTATFTIDDATTSSKGIVTLNSATNSTSTTDAATPSAVKSAYDKANAAMPKSGGTFTGAVTLNADPTANLGAATKQYVDTQISTAIGASDAMVFKGTLGTGGTVTAVPTTGVVKGDTYKVITAGTWAGSTCKVGDLLIALNSGSIEANTTNWAYVPSGNENETTIKYSTTTQNLTTSAQTGAITVGEAATKQVDTTISAASTSTKLPTSQAVASFVEGKGYLTSSGTIANATNATQLKNSRNFSITGGATAAAVAFNGTQNVALNVTSVSTDVLTNGSDTLVLDGNFT